MKAQPPFFDATLERMLQDLAEAERIGVFRSTPVKALDFMGEQQAERFPAVFRLLKVALPVAAALAFAVGIEMVQPTRPMSDFHAVSSDCDRFQSTARVNVSAFNACMTGPGGSISAPECRCVDFDADGDVDLLDFGQFQRQAGQS